MVLAEAIAFGRRLNSTGEAVGGAVVGFMTGTVGWVTVAGPPKLIPPSGRTKSSSASPGT